jgi:cytoskeleton protein RodZ
MPDNNGEIRPAPRAQPAALGLGERLRSARKAKALSVAQVSEALRLEEPLVVALEEERFEALGAPVFVRGHLRRYAQLVGLSTQSVMDAYLAAAPESTELPTLARPRAEPELVRAGPWTLWVAGAVVLVVVVLVLAGGDEPETKPPSTTAPVQLAPEPVPVPVPVPLPGTVQSPAAAAPEQSPAVPSVATPDAAPAATGVAPAPGPVAAPPMPERLQLVLQFAEDGWVNIADADRRLLYGLQRAGTRRELEGRPPFRLMLGNARGTTVSVAGSRYPIPPEKIADNVARFDIAAPAAAPAQ